MNKEIQFYSDYNGNNLALLEINNASDETILQLKTKSFITFYLIFSNSY